MRPPRPRWRAGAASPRCNCPARGRTRPRSPAAAAGPDWPAAYRSSCCRRRRSAPPPRRRARRLALAVSLVVKNQLVIASVTMRLISSGIAQSPERMPPSTCATGTCSFCAVIAQAMVEVTSPTTSTESLRSLDQQPLVARHDRRGLLGLRARADLEIDVRRGNAELVEEIARHARVVVLAGVDETIAQPAAVALRASRRANDRRDLHEVRPRTGDHVDERWLSRRALQCLRQLDSDAADLEHLVEGIGDAPPCSTACTKAAAQALCPCPGATGTCCGSRASRSRAAGGSCRAAARRPPAEDLEPLLRERLAAVGEVVDGADRAVGELQRDRRGVAVVPPCARLGMSD